MYLHLLHFPCSGFIQASSWIKELGAHCAPKGCWPSGGYTETSPSSVSICICLFVLWCSLNFMKFHRDIMSWKKIAPIWQMSELSTERFVAVVGALSYSRHRAWEHCCQPWLLTCHPLRCSAEPQHFLKQTDFKHSTNFLLSFFFIRLFVYIRFNSDKRPEIISCH